MNDGILREKDETTEWPGHGRRLVSLLDILGGGQKICDRCGRWQGFSALTPEQADEQLAEFGWIKAGNEDLCRLCAAQDERG